ncbi:MAG: LegC family aminotransferase [bacterium]
MNRYNIPLSVPEIKSNEWKYVKDCLDQGWVSSAGEYVDRFEKTLAGYVGSKHAVATVNGTSALHVSLVACGIIPDDEVIVPALTFIAPANVVSYCNAHPVLMDCDEQTLCMDVHKVVTFLSNECIQRTDGNTYNKATNRKIKAIIPVHVFGHPTDMDELVNICSKKNIDIIEDATESLGSVYKDIKTGSIGRIGCFSFNGNKIITTGGGGMAVTNDSRLASRLKHLTIQANKDPLEYDHDEVGYNYRLSNIQAAMGIAQMEKIDEFIAIKRKHARLYKELLSGSKSYTLFWEMPWARSNFWFYTIRVAPETKKPLMNFLLSKGIQVRSIWKLMQNLPMYQNCQSYKIEVADKIYNSCFNIPCSVNLTDDEIKFIAESIAEYF